MLLSTTSNMRQKAAETMWRCHNSKDVKTVSSRKRVFSHAGAWLVNLEVSQKPVQAWVFIWDGVCIAPGFVASPASGLSWGEPGVTLTSDINLTMAKKKACIKQLKTKDWWSIGTFSWHGGRGLLNSSYQILITKTHLYVQLVKNIYFI